jgi:putative addiction module component (TIGR02574 family)
MSNLHNEIGSLSAAEKFELLDALWESLEADAPTLTDDQRAELDYRVARYERNPFRCDSMGASPGSPV